MPVLPLLQACLASLILLAVARAMARPLRLDDHRLDPLVVGFLWLYLVSLTTLAFGAVGELDPTPMTVVLLGAGIFLAVLRLRRGPAVTTPARRSIARPSALTKACVAVLALIAIRLAVHVWLFPPYVQDTLVYHLPNVAEWIRHERITTFETAATRTFWPAGFALVQTWFALFLHHDAFLDAAGIPWYALAVGAVYSCGRSLGLRRPLAALAATAFAATPATLLHATSCNNDIAIAGSFLLVLALVLDHRARGGHGAQRLVIAALVFALAFGIKPYIAFAAPGLLLAAWWCKRAAPATESPRRPIPVGLLAFAAASGLLLAGFWYVRNWIEFDNPFYPTDFRLFGEVIFGTGENKSQQGTFSLAGLVENLRQLATEKIFDDHRMFHADLANMTGWGWCAFACGLPALAYAVVTRPAMRWVAAAFVLAMLGVLSFVTPDLWNMRFLLWWPALPALAVAVFLRHARPRPLRLVFLALTWSCIGLNLIGSINIDDTLPKGWTALARMPLAERSAASFGLYSRPWFAETLALVPADEPIGYHHHGNGFIYPLYDADFSREVRHVWIDRDTDVRSAMRARGVRYLLVYRPYVGIANRIDAAVRAGDLRVLGEVRGSVGKLLTGLYATP